MEFDAKTAIIIGFFCKPEEKEANRKCFCYACAFPLTVRSLSRFEIYNTCLVICQLCWNFLLGKLCWPEVKFHFLRNARKIGPRALKAHLDSTFCMLCFFVSRSYHSLESFSYMYWNITILLFSERRKLKKVKGRRSWKTSFI